MKLDTYHYHEALDRTFMIQELIENAIGHHPVYGSAPEEVKELIVDVQDLLYKYYKWCGEQQDNTSEGET